MKKMIAFFAIILVLMLRISYVFSNQLETGNTFEIAFDLRKKQILQGWLNDYDLPKVWTGTFIKGYPLFIFLDIFSLNENRNYKLSIELDADDCFEVLDDVCKYETPEFSLDESGIGDVFLYSNFEIPYHIFVLFLKDTIAMSYISILSSSLELSQLNLCEIGFISNNKNFLWEGDYIRSQILEGNWKATGIILGEEWIPFYGIVKITTKKIQHTNTKITKIIGVNANTGAILNLNINFDSNTKIWRHNNSRYIAVWKNLHEGSENGFFIQLLH